MKYQQVGIDTALITMPEPKILWIELTSKCPFRCLFCSRELLRGHGQHMPFPLLEKIVAQLKEPEIIRINHAGESANYPRLLDAIKLLKTTGARIEMVTTLASLNSNRMRALVTNGLDQLTISLHTMDSDQYKSIFGHASIEQLKTKLSQLMQLVEDAGANAPNIDISFVAMDRNMDQLPKVAAYVEALGIHQINVLRVIRRSAIEETFSIELTNNRLTPHYRNSLNTTIENTRQQFPGMSIVKTNNTSEEDYPINDVPQYSSKPVAENQRISTCIENPWETAHILASGEIMVCGCGGEGAPEDAMGNLHEQSLEEIWHGEKYTGFRREYVFGKANHCQDCSWKKVYETAPLLPNMTASQYNFQFIYGWYPEDTNEIIWSKKVAKLLLSKLPGSEYLLLQGILPAWGTLASNQLQISCNGVLIGEVENNTQQNQGFEKSLSIKEIQTPQLLIEFICKNTYIPGDHLTDSADFRSLGFAFISTKQL